MQHMVFGLSWPLLATNCYRRRTGIEYILHHIFQPCRQTIASVQFKTWCILIFMATPPPSGKYPARQKLPNQLPTFALRHALVSLEEPTNGDVWCNLNAVLSKKRCFRNRVFTHYGLKAYKYKVVGVYRHTQICVMLWQRASMIFWVKMPLNFLLIRGFLLVLATGSAWISSCLPALLSSFQTPCRLRQHLVDGSSNLAKYTPGAASRPTNVFWIVLRSHQPSLFEVLFECCQNFVEDLRQRQTSK